MKRFLAPLVTLLAVAGTPAVAEEAPYQFALAKLLLQEGSVAEALSAFERVIQLRSDDPYARLEYAQVLFRIAQSQGDSRFQPGQLQRASEQIDRARELAPENVDVLRLVGQIYMALADRDPAALPVAIEALEGIRAQEPWDVQSMIALGQIYMAQGEAARGADVFAEAARYIPNNRILFSFLADARERAGQGLEAEKALDKILELDPYDIENRIRLAELRNRRGAHEEVLATLDAAPSELQDEERLLYLRGRALLLSDRPEEALATVDQLVARKPDHRLGLFATELRARVLERLGRQEEASRELQSLLDMDPGNADLVRRVAGRLAEAKGREEAIAFLHGFLERHGDGGEPPAEMQRALETARLSLAVLYLQDEDFEDALSALAPLVTSPESEARATGILNSAEVLFRAGRSQEALGLLEKGEAEAPLLAGKRVEILLRTEADKDARRLLRSLSHSGEIEGALAAVQSYHGLQRYEETLPVLRELTRKHPESVEPLFLLGAAEERSGAPARAAKTFLQLLDQKPDHAPTLNYLGYMWADLGENLEQALGLLERAVEIDPHNGAYIDSIGWVHFRLGNYVQAREYLEQAVVLVPGDPVVYAHLGDVYVALGETTKAAELYRRALQVADSGDAQDLDLNAVRHKLDQLPAD